MLRRLRDCLWPKPPLVGLEAILEDVAAGRLAPEEAASRIRTLAAKPYLPAWLPRLFRLLGAIALIVGLAMACYQVVTVIGSRETPGRVVEMVGDECVAPVVEYSVGGRRYTVQGTVHSQPPAYVVGQQVAVLYRPDNPAQARINTFTERGLFPVVFAGAGVWCLILGLILQRFLGTKANREGLG
jgi:hypothetical protein